jgi:phosphoserine phosphatase RsbX
MAQMIGRDGTVGPLRWAVVNRALDGQGVSGDLHVVLAAGDGALVAVIDGLGHGADAAAAAETAAHVLAAEPSRMPPEALLACHRALACTRGAVVSIVRVEGSVLSWAGVGNVEAVVVRGLNSPSRNARLLLAGGIVGHSMPALRRSDIALMRGDLLVMGTDGLCADFTQHINAATSPERIVHHLVSCCRTGRDDTLALAARYDGGPA